MDDPLKKFVSGRVGQCSKGCCVEVTIKGETEEPLPREVVLATLAGIMEQVKEHGLPHENKEELAATPEPGAPAELEIDPKDNILLH